MPEAFDREAKKPGARVRTVMKGPDKGRLIAKAPGSAHPVLGGKRGHRKRSRKRTAKEFQRFM